MAVREEGPRSGRPFGGVGMPRSEGFGLCARSGRKHSSNLRKFAGKLGGALTSAGLGSTRLRVVNQLDLSTSGNQPVPSMTLNRALATRTGPVGQVRLGGEAHGVEVIGIVYPLPHLCGVNKHHCGVFVVK